MGCTCNEAKVIAVCAVGLSLCVGVRRGELGVLLNKNVEQGLERVWVLCDRYTIGSHPFLLGTDNE